MKKTFLKILAFSLIGGSTLTLSSSVKAKPSETYNKEECWNNYDFITPNSYKYRYCLVENGVLKKIDLTGQTLKDKVILNKPKREIDKNSSYLFYPEEEFIYTKKNIIEYTIEDDELIKYSCKRKKFNRKYIKSKECTRTRIGVRPDGFYYKQGKSNQAQGKLLDSIQDFSKEIDLNPSSETYFSRAEVRFNLGNLVDALEDINKSIEFSPSNLYALNLRSEIRKELKNYEGESEDLNVLIKLLQNIVNEGKENLENLKDIKFFKRNSNAYFLIEGPTWIESKENANKLGGDLVTINNEAENKWLVRKFSDSSIYPKEDFKGQYWIGYQYLSDKFEWNSGYKATYYNWKVGTQIHKLSSSNYAKIIIFSNHSDSERHSGKWDISSNQNNSFIYGIGEANIAQKFEDVDSKFKNIFYRQAVAKSQLADTKNAIKAFNQEIKNNPTNGQAYFDRGLERFWLNRKAACADLLKGLSLGAKNTSQKMINSKIDSTLFKECKQTNALKYEKISNNYNLEKTINELFYLIKKYSILIPILLIIITYLYMKNNNNKEK